MLLAIDTATRTASVALFDENGVRGETTWFARENHTVSLMPQLKSLLSVCGVALETVEAIGVASGPGSFTGLRIGLAAAKGLALARGLPLIGVPTFDGLARVLALRSLPMWLLIQAGRGRYAAAPYRLSNGRVGRAADYLIADAEGLEAAIVHESDGQGNGEVLVGGEVDDRLRSVLTSRLDRIVLADPALALRRASYLAAVAWESWKQGRVDDLQSLSPYYIPTASLPQAMSG